MRSTTGFRRTLALAAALGAGWAADGALACTCMQRPDPATEFAESDAVFLGTVTAVRRPEMPLWFYELLNEVDHRLGTTFLRDAWDVTVSLSVDASWKGVATRRARVQTGSGGGDCGVPFREGSQYLIYASTWERELYTSICSRTAPQALAAEDLAFLADHSQLTRSEPVTLPRLPMVVALLLVAGSCVLVLRLWDGSGRRQHGLPRPDRSP